MFDVFKEPHQLKFEKKSRRTWKEGIDRVTLYLLMEVSKPAQTAEVNIMQLKLKQ
jgi:hypothetical protein